MSKSEAGVARERNTKGDGESVAMEGWQTDRKSELPISISYNLRIVWQCKTTPETKQCTWVRLLRAQHAGLSLVGEPEVKTIETAELWTAISLAHDIQSSCSSWIGRQSTKNVISRLAEKILTLQNSFKKRKEAWAWSVRTGPQRYYKRKLRR